MHPAIEIEMNSALVELTTVTAVSVTVVVVAKNHWPNLARPSLIIRSSGDLIEASSKAVAGGLRESGSNVLSIIGTSVANILDTVRRWQFLPFIFHTGKLNLIIRTWRPLLAGKVGRRCRPNGLLPKWPVYDEQCRWMLLR